MTAVSEQTFTTIPYTRLPGFTKAWHAVASHSGKLTDLYLRQPASLEACAYAAKETLGHPRSWRELAEIIGKVSREYGVPETSLARLQLLAGGKAVMVVTGQQVGYLGGPLYTFLKAYHATRLAAHLEERLGLPVLPLFWLEGRDHDLEEVRDANYLTSSGELKTLRFDPEKEIPGYEVGRYRVSAEEHLKELAAALESPRESGMQTLSAAYSNTTLTDGMGRLLGTLLGPRGLLVVEGMDPRLKALAAPLWEKIISSGTRLTELFYARARDLEAAGWHTPMTPTHDTHLYYLTRDHRRASFTFSGQLKHPDGHTENLTEREVSDLVRRDPDAISPKAALRPPYQDYLLPTIAYVAGPGEMEYHAQLTPFYKEFGITATSLFPRLSATITDHRVDRQLQKLDLSMEDVIRHPRQELIHRVLREEDQGQTAAMFEKGRAEIQAAFDKLRNSVAGIDPTLAGAVEASAGRALHPLEHLREKAEKALKQKHAAKLARLEKALNALHPQDHLAERYLCTGYYLTKYGPEKILAALDNLPAETSGHVLLTVE